MKIINKKISYRQKPYIIAEMSSNHLQKVSLAKKIILAAKKSGASAVKIQTFEPEDITIKSNNEKFLIKKGLWKNNKLFDLYKKIYMPMEKQKELFIYAKKINLALFSSPLSIRNVNFLKKNNCPAYKIPSFEANDFSLISKCIDTKKPLIISTGVSSIDEIKELYNFIKSKKYLKKTAILHCNSSYPAKSEDMRIDYINILKNKFKNMQIGFSDHSLNSTSAICAVANGATIIEKHIALDRKLGGPDCKFSLEPIEFKEFVNDVNNAWECMGYNKKKRIFNSTFKRSIFAIKDIKKGEKFTIKNIGTYRPNIGLSANNYFKILNKKSKYNYRKFSSIKKTN